MIGTSSRPELIDPALLRPGRIENRLLVGPPDKESRVAILKGFCDFEEDSLVKLADLTDGFTGAHIKSVFYNAQMSYIQREPSIMGLDDILKAIDVCRLEMNQSVSLHPLQFRPGTRIALA